MIDVTKPGEKTKVAFLVADAWGEVQYGLASRYGDGSATDIDLLDADAVTPHCALAMMLDGSLLRVDAGILRVTDEDEADKLWGARIATVERIGEGLRIEITDADAWKMVVGKVVAV